MLFVYCNAPCKAWEYGVIPHVKHFYALLHLVMLYVKHVCVLLALLMPHVRHVCV